MPSPSGCGSGSARPYTVTTRPISASIGVAVLSGGGTGATADALLESADAAMYRSKQGGRDRVTLVGI